MLVIIDYGLGNVRSVQNAFEYLGADVCVTRDPATLAGASALVLPGVGAFAEGMARIDHHGLRAPIAEALGSGKPFLGICLGFQLMMASSTENGETAGLGMFPMHVRRLQTVARLPHIDWARLSPAADARWPDRLLKGVENEYFYFVHSYGVLGEWGDSAVCMAEYGHCPFVAAIEQGNVVGTQFHPEKSGEAGLQLLSNFLGFAA